jgi:hypothetical protein
MSTVSAPVAGQPGSSPPGDPSPTDTNTNDPDPDAYAFAATPRQLRFNVPERLYLLPGTALIAGTTLGLVRGSRAASLRFLAENAHRPPTTVQGWYFYNKTKNYRVMMAGLRMAALDAGRLAATAAGWVGIEEGMRRVGGAAEAREAVAGLGTAAVFSAVCECGRVALGFYARARVFCTG